MNKIENKLNKLKSTQNDKKTTLTPKETIEVLNIISNKLPDFKYSSILAICPKSENLIYGLSLLEPQYIVSLQMNELDVHLIQNLSLLQTSCDVIQTQSQPFISKFFDFAVVGPSLDRLKSTEFQKIKIADSLAKKTFFCFSYEHSKLLSEKYPNAILIGQVSIQMQISTKYKNEVQNLKFFNIYEI